MVDKSNLKSVEASEHSTPKKTEAQEKTDAKIERQEISRETSEIVSGAESQEGKEGAVEFSEGKVSERVSESKKKASGAKSSNLTADEIEAIRAKLLKNLPPQAVMMKQIQRSLRGEEKQLKKQYRSARRKGPKAAWQLNNVVAKLRKVHEYFALLANATFEIVKQLWLKIVHGV